MNKIQHKISPSEITHGIITLRASDGTKDFFSSLSEYFTMEIKGVKLFDRRLSARKIWIGYVIMRQFHPYQIITLAKNENVVSVE